MESIAEGQFLQWAETKAMRLNPRYPDSAVLEYQQPSDARFWKIPAKPERRPYFLNSFLDLMGDWTHCYVLRHLGSWYNSMNVDSDGINNVVETVIIKGLGIPIGTADVLVFDRGEQAELVTLLLSITMLGWSVGSDVYVVPDHAKEFLQTDHHGVIHVIGDQATLEEWVQAMSQRGFNLPSDLPDQTFRGPQWMGKTNS